MESIVRCLTFLFNGVFFVSFLISPSVHSIYHLIKRLAVCDSRLLLVKTVSVNVYSVCNKASQPSEIEYVVIVLFLDHGYSLVTA